MFDKLIPLLISAGFGMLIDLFTLLLWVIIIKIYKIDYSKYYPNEKLEDMTGFMFIFFITFIVSSIICYKLIT